MRIKFISSGNKLIDKELEKVEKAIIGLKKYRTTIN